MGGVFSHMSPTFNLLLKLDKKHNYRISSNIAPGCSIFKGSSVEGGLIRGGSTREGGLFFGPTNLEGALFFKEIIITCKVKMIRTFC